MDELARLHRRVTVLNFAVGGLVLGLLALVAVQWSQRTLVAPPGPMTATSLVLVDGTGKDRAWLGVDGTGDVAIRLLDGGESPRVVLRAGDLHATVELLDADGRTAVRASSVAASSSVQVNRGTGTAQLVSADGGTVVAVADLDRQLSGELRVGDGGAQAAVAYQPVDGAPEGAALVAGERPGELGPEVVLSRSGWGFDASLHPKDGAPQVLLVGDTAGEVWRPGEPMRAVTPRGAPGSDP